MKAQLLRQMLRYYVPLLDQTTDRRQHEFLLYIGKNRTAYLRRIALSLPRHTDRITELQLSAQLLPVFHAGAPDQLSGIPVAHDPHAVSVEPVHLLDIRLLIFPLLLIRIQRLHVFRHSFPGIQFKQCI